MAALPLFDANGRRVAEVKFDPHKSSGYPDAIVWNRRLFLAHEEAKYQEGRVLHVPSEDTVAVFVDGVEYTAK